MSGVIRWEEPPPVPPSLKQVRPSAADELRERPGEWAAVRECDTSQAARNVAHRIRNGWHVAFRPQGSFEATCRKVGDTFTVYARYVGGES